MTDGNGNDWEMECSFSVVEAAINSALFKYTNKNALGIEQTAKAL